MILLIAQNMNSLKKLATHVIPYIICCLHIVQVISTCLNILLTCIRNLLSFGYYINMFNKIAGPAMFLFVCVF